ncbi:hypothetical protein OKW45_003701 [Paraburkholderia sp. WSM4175]|uniref:hypothetical protein n=1 Tax=Paraburkholderia sp. WSM4175 TaxID=2991072 RepID=UPI003D20E2C9
MMPAFEPVRIEPPSDWRALEEGVRLAVGALGFDARGLVAGLERLRADDGLRNAYELLQMLVAGSAACIWSPAVCRKRRSV